MVTTHWPGIGPLKMPLLGASEDLGGPRVTRFGRFGDQILVSTAADWSAWIRHMVTTHPAFYRPLGPRGPPESEKLRQRGRTLSGQFKNCPDNPETVQTI